ncbi:GNAT family N-acetyltransferase [Dyella sp. 20L07]|uniref:GNAT family N-acetyltransferase n=1 Tax=Dyella sp. 20L07 TaxID=3384240 RepID=UPI003D2AE197
MAALKSLPASLELVAPTVRLRPWQPGHAEALHEAARESIATVGRWLPWCSESYDWEDSVSWVEHCQSGWIRGEPYAFAIFDLQGRLLGGIGLSRLDRVHRSANLGYWVRQQDQGKGIASAAVAAIVDFGFNTLGLLRIEIVVATDNQASRRTAERAGAHLDGISPSRLWHQGESIAAAVYSLLPPDNEATSPGPTLESGPLRLRPFIAADADALFTALHESMDSISRWQDWCTPQYSHDDGRHWIAKTRLAWCGAGDECALAMVDRDSDALIGSIAINHWQSSYRMANIGYWVRQSRQGQGFASRAVRLLARHALQSTELQRLEIVAATENLASRRVAEKVGAHFEGTARSRLTFQGLPQDAAVYSLIVTDLD